MYTVVYAASMIWRPSSRVFVVSPEGKEQELSTYRLYSKRKDGVLKLNNARNWIPHTENCVYFEDDIYVPSHMGHCEELGWRAMKLTDEPPDRFRCVLEGDELSDIVEADEL